MDSRSGLIARFEGSVVAHATYPFGADIIKKALTEGGVNVECIPFGMFGIFRSRQNPASVQWMSP
jgi:hypothetical protein